VEVEEKEVKKVMVMGNLRMWRRRRRGGGSGGGRK
jgi:hypothetical protein